MNPVHEAETWRHGAGASPFSFMFLLAGLAVAGCNREAEVATTARPPYERTIATLAQPRPDTHPAIALVERDLRRPKPLLISMNFPGAGGLVADAWLFENPVSDEIRHEPRADGGLTLFHDLRDFPATLETVVTTHPGRVDFVVHYRLDAGESYPDELPQPILCYQLKFAPGYAYDVARGYGEFGRRGFLFRGEQAVSMSEWSRTQVLGDQPAKDYMNWWREPDGDKVFFPWAQRFRSSWRAFGDPGKTDGFSLDRFDQPIVGVVSREGAHLTALAGPDAYVVGQLWHTCLHLEQPWNFEEGDATWRLSAYGLPNDTAALLARVREDYPGARQGGS